MAKDFRFSFSLNFLWFFPDQTLLSLNIEDNKWLENLIGNLKNKIGNKQENVVKNNEA